MRLALATAALLVAAWIALAPPPELPRALPELHPPPATLSVNDDCRPGCWAFKHEAHAARAAARAALRARQETPP